MVQSHPGLVLMELALFQHKVRATGKGDAAMVHGPERWAQMAGSSMYAQTNTLSKQVELWRGGSGGGLARGILRAGGGISVAVVVPIPYGLDWTLTFPSFLQ